MLLSNESPRSTTPTRAPPMSECNPDFRNASERSIDLPAATSLHKPTIDDMSEIKPGILEMIQEEQRVSYFIKWPGLWTSEFKPNGC